MKVADLSGAELDYWVARAMGERAKIEDWGEPVCIAQIDAFEPVPFKPSTLWSDGGPIIERELNVVERFRGDDMAWIASYGDPECPRSETGPTPLIASMRAFVASRFGDEVPGEK